MRVVMVTGGGLGPPDLVERAAQAARAGVSCIQVREKHLPGRALADLVGRIVSVVAGTTAEVWVNGRPDVAALCRAHGVQLPEDGLPVASVKGAFPGLRIGASRHSVDGVRRAEGDGADAVVLGPVFPTPGKEASALGLAVLAEACRAVSIPVIAIGGIEASNVRSAREAGAAGVALLRPFLGSPREVVERLGEALR